MNVASNVAVFWDYENCALPATEPSYTIVNKIRLLAHQYGSVKTFKAYLEYPEQTSLKSMALRSELQSCGVSLIDCPHNGRKDVADKMMMVDMMAHAIDNPAPATIILISGDRDFVYAVSILSLRQYRIILLAPRNAHGGLKGQAEAVYNWPEDFLPGLPAVAQSLASPPKKAAEWKPSKAIPVTLQDFWQKKLPAPPPRVPSSQPQRASADPNAFALLAPEASLSDDSPDGGAETHSAGNTSSEPAPPAGSHFTSVPVDAATNTTSTVLRVTDGTSEEGEVVDSTTKTNAPGAPSPLRPPGLFLTNSTASASTQAMPVFGGTSSFGGSFTMPSTSSIFGLSASASPFVFSPAPSTSLAAPPSRQPREEAEDDTTWQTFSRVVKKRPAQIPAEFKPLVKVLKRQLAEGTARVESSQLGTLLSAEAA